MNIALWIVQGLLAAMFLMGGILKSFRYEQAKASMPWVKDMSRGTVSFIGVSELLGAIGLILPGVTGIAPWLTAIAGIGIAVIMILAIVLHAKRRENQAIGMNVILLLLAAFVAVGRLFIESL